MLPASICQLRTSAMPGNLKMTRCGFLCTICGNWPITNILTRLLTCLPALDYFETDEQHISSLINFHNALKPAGLLVMDYFNVVKYCKNWFLKKQNC